MVGVVGGMVVMMMVYALKRYPRAKVVTGGVVMMMVRRCLALRNGLIVWVWCMSRA